MKKAKSRKQSIDVVIGGNLKTDEYNIAFCPIKSDSVVFELNYLSKKDLQEIKSAVDCALED